MSCAKIWPIFRNMYVKEIVVKLEPNSITTVKTVLKPKKLFIIKSQFGKKTSCAEIWPIFRKKGNCGEFKT